MQAAIITIITDSLGMPRDCTSIEHTWVYQLMLANKQKKGGNKKNELFISFQCEHDIQKILLSKNKIC